MLVALGVAAAGMRARPSERDLGGRSSVLMGRESLGSTQRPSVALEYGEDANT